MEEEVRRERRRAEYMARAAAWQLEKEEAEANKVLYTACYDMAFPLCHCPESRHLLMHQVHVCVPQQSPALGSGRAEASIRPFHAGPRSVNRMGSSIQISPDKGNECRKGFSE